MTGLQRVEVTEHGSWARLPPLDALGLTHGFSCRDLEGPGGTGEALASLLGLQALPRARLTQRHTDRVREARGGPQPSPPPVGDALISRDPRVVLAVSTADCVPLLVLDRARGAVGVVHAGWRGTRAGILPRTLAAMARSFGTEPAEVAIGVGPCIRACCYEVGEDVRSAFTAEWPAGAAWFGPGPAGTPHLDLVAANRAQAEALDVPEGAFVDPSWCTRCRRDLFFSYRGDGPGTGRIVTLAAAPLSSTPGSG